MLLHRPSQSSSGKITYLREGHFPGRGHAKSGLRLLGWILFAAWLVLVTTASARISISGAHGDETGEEGI